MRSGEEGIDLPLLSVEREGMCPRFCWHHLKAAQSNSVDDVDDAGLSDGHVEPRELRVQEDDVRSSAERDIAEHAAGRGVDSDQHAGTAGAEQSTCRLVNIQAVRAIGRDFEDL